MKPAQLRMWETEDLPMFSGGVYGIAPEPFNPKVEEKQEALPGIDLRPQFGQKEEYHANR
jgi:hypothetical protein